MVHKIRSRAQWALPMMIGMCLLALIAHVQPAMALTPIPTPNPTPGSYGLEAIKPQAPPTQGATITTPGNGASFATSLLTINGICPNGLLVQVYDNGVMVGSVMCQNGSFSLQASLFAGTNALSAIVYDNLDQAGPVSNIVTVTYIDTHFNAFGALITLTSSYGRRSSPAGSELGWPLQLSGGTGPYAFSIDWGDGVPVQLRSQSFAGLVSLVHVYKKAGIYQVNIQATDVSGVSAFLQVVALANGELDSSSTPSTTGKTSGTTPPTILWTPTITSLILLPPAFWLGRLSQLTSLHNKLLKERDSYTKE
jgi:hypothetical protein